MINHKFVWTYGPYGFDYTNPTKEIHKEKMEHLFGFINKIVLESGQENPVFNCGSIALNVIKECFYINNKLLECVVYVPSYDHNLVTFGDVQITISSHYNIPILFYSKITSYTKKEKCSLLVKRLQSSIETDNFSLALIDAQNIIEVLKKEKQNDK